MEEDLVVGTVPLVPLEPFESLELFGDLAVLELVFFRRNSLKKGIVSLRYFVCYSSCLQTAITFMEKRVE